MTLKRALIGLLVIAILLAGGVFTYRAFFETEATGLDAAPAAVSSVAPTARAAVDEIAIPGQTGSVSAEGRVLPLRSANLALPGSGAIIEILAGEGAAVTAGQPILRLDDTDQAAALRAAEAALAQARAAQEAAGAAVEAARAGVEAAGLDVRAAELELSLASAEPRPEEIALGESGLALAQAQVAAATAAQAQVLEGAGAARVRAAEADLRAAEAAAVPPRLRLEELRLQGDAADDGDLAEAERAYNAALAAIEAARVALTELETGATTAQRNAAAGGVNAAAAQRDAAQADLDLLRAGGSAETVAVAEAVLSGAQAGLAEAQARLAAAETGVTGAQAQVTGAEAAVAAAQAALNDRTLLAPFDGIVADLPFGLGEVAPAGGPVAVVADFSGWLVETTELIERDTVSVAAGDRVEVRVDALPDETFSGVVTAIGAIAQEVQGDITYPVTIRLDAPEAPLRWGMTVFVTIDTAETD